MRLRGRKGRLESDFRKRVLVGKPCNLPCGTVDELAECLISLCCCAMMPVPFQLKQKTPRRIVMPSSPSVPIRAMQMGPTTRVQYFSMFDENGTTSSLHVDVVLALSISPLKLRNSRSLSPSAYQHQHLWKMVRPACPSAHHRWS
jgi:hypothetical protein